MPPLTTSTTISPPKTHTCFFYGTLMAPSILSRVTGHPYTPTSTSTTLITAATAKFQPRPALLSHHRRHRVRSADYPAIIPSSTPEACVRGTCVSGLSDADVWRLDLFEGDEYVRRRVSVRILADERGKRNGGEGKADRQGVEGGEGDGEMVEADTYVWVAPKSRLEDQEWDFEEFVREKMWRWDGGAEREDYDVVDAAVEAREREGSGVGDGKDVGDPTGGRGVNGEFERAIGDASSVGDIPREMVESAV